MKRNLYILVTLLLTCAVLLSSGCIEVHFVKDALYPEETTPVYVTTERLKMSHVFSTRIGNLSSIEYSASEPVDIKEKTHWMKVDISVTMETVPIPLPSDIQRYVEINITMPDGTVWFGERFNTTVNRSLEIMSPMPGDWLFSVIGTGYGSDLIQYHDAFSLMVRTEEMK